MFIPLKKILKERIARLGNREKINLGFLQKKWPLLINDLVEDEFLKHELKKTKPIKLKQYILTIEVKNQIQSSEISFLAYDLMDKINQIFGYPAVKKIFFKIKNENYK